MKFYCERPVLGKIVVLTYSGAREFECELPWAGISIISDHDIAFPKLSEVNRIGLLQMRFDDRLAPSKGISEEQGNVVAAFVKKYWNDCGILMIHCAAGHSRSPAVAKAISEIYQPEFASFYDDFHEPNRLVHFVVSRAIKNNPPAS